MEGYFLWKIMIVAGREMRQVFAVGKIRRTVAGHQCGYCNNPVTNRVLPSPTPEENAFEKRIQSGGPRRDFPAPIAGDRPALQQIKRMVCPVVFGVVGTDGGGGPVKDREQ